MRRQQNKRTAFTLVEMLVVIAIIAALFAMIVLMFPSFSEQKRANNGATMLQGWLYQAKQKAFRDGAPRGLRLFLGATVATQVTECQFIETPDDFTGGTIRTGSNPKEVIIGGGIDVIRGDPDPNNWLVQYGDYLEIQGLGLAHRISYPTATVPFPIKFDPVKSETVLTLDSDVPYPITGTTHYRIMRRPRVVGEEALKLPDYVAIDLKTNVDYGYGLPTNSDGSVDVLFSPSGKVITPGVATDFMPFWVRDINQTSPFEGNPAIIAVHVRSGLVVGHAPADPSDPYAKVRKGTSED